MDPRRVIAHCHLPAHRESERGHAARRSHGLAVGAVALLLLLPAIVNGFPLIFPDSATYLGIALGPDYAIDRSSFYGLALKPLVNVLPGVAGLWLAVAVQAIAISVTLVVAANVLGGGPNRPSRETRNRGQARRSPLLWLCIAATVLLTSLPWHAGQLMPDAFTGALVLLAILAATRDPTASGVPLLWLAAAALALTHYTHLVLLPAVSMAAVAAQALLGLGRRSSVRRLAAVLLATSFAFAALVAANGTALKRWTPSPAGPVFLFARLHEDGLIAPWFDRHCGRDAPRPLCAERHLIPDDSQVFLWGDDEGPAARHIWQPQSDSERWRWVEMMSQANRGAIAEAPLAFVATTIRGAVRQLTHFAAIDDECPIACGRVSSGGIAYILPKYLPEALPVLARSMQYRDMTPKAFVRALTTPVAVLALFLIPAALALAWRRRDAIALAFSGGIATALLVNAVLAGALSDVHDRYQSRVVWLAPFLILLLALRWRRPACPEPAPGA